MTDQLREALQDIAAYYPNSWAADRANRALSTAAQPAAAHITWDASGRRCVNGFPDGQPASLEQAQPSRWHVGDSKFESWFSEYDMKHKGTKQQMRDAYAAGMGELEQAQTIGEVAVVMQTGTHQSVKWTTNTPLDHGTKLYTAPPKPVPMIPDQRTDMACAVAQISTGRSSREVASLAIEWVERHYGITGESK
jgi:hypothetical protein